MGIGTNGGLIIGKRILVLEGTTVLLTSQAPPPPSTDTYNREPFNHPSLEALPKVQAVDLGDVLSKLRVGQLARSYGIDQVTRWKPRNVCSSSEPPRGPYQIQSNSPIAA